MVHPLKNRRGQTSLEYLLLLAVTFIAAYIMVRGPVGTFTKELFTHITSGIQNLITHAEWSSEQLDYGRPGHPTSTNRLKPLHL